MDDQAVKRALSRSTRTRAARRMRAEPTGAAVTASPPADPSSPGLRVLRLFTAFSQRRYSDVTRIRLAPETLAATEKSTKGAVL
jgi:hypothetical protein